MGHSPPFNNSASNFRAILFQIQTARAETVSPDYRHQSAQSLRRGKLSADKLFEFSLRFTDFKAISWNQCNLQNCCSCKVAPIKDFEKIALRSAPN